MARLRIRHKSRWLDICQSEFYIRKQNSWFRLLPSRGLRVRHGSNNYWLPIDCLSENDCGDDVYGGTEDGKGANSSGPPAGTTPREVGHPGDPTTPEGTNWPKDPKAPVPNPAKPGDPKKPQTTEPEDTEPEDNPPNDLSNEGNLDPSNPVYNDPDRGSSLTGNGDNTKPNGTYQKDKGKYPPGYDLPDSGGPDAGVKTNEDGEKCIFRPGLNVCETLDEGGSSTDENDGTVDKPISCPATIYDQGKTITEFYVDMKDVSGTAKIEYYVYNGKASVDVYYAGMIVASTQTQVTGRAVLEFNYDTAAGEGETKIFIRVRKQASAGWAITVRCPNTEMDEGTITNPAACHGTFEANEGAGAGVHEMIHEMGPTAGPVFIRYQMWNLPDRLKVIYRGQVVAQTQGYVVGEGDLTFDYTPVDGNTVITIRIESITADTTWAYLIGCPGEQGTPVDPAPCTVEEPLFSGGAGTTDTFYALGPDPGTVIIRYQMWYEPDRLDVYQGSTLVATTGGKVSGEGQVSFYYDPANGNNIRIRVIGEGRTTWGVLVSCPYNNPAIHVVAKQTEFIEGTNSSSQACFDIFIDEAVPVDVKVDYITEDITAIGSTGMMRVLGYDAFANPMFAMYDGTGRVLFEPGFPKYYNTANVNTTNPSQMTNTTLFLANCLNWLAEKRASTTKQILVFSDAKTGEDYNLKEWFNETFSNAASVNDYTVILRDRSNYAAETIQWSTEFLSNFAAVVFLGTAPYNNVIGEGVADNIYSFVMSSGGGLMLITDHDVFQLNVNEIAAKFGASFSGMVERTPQSFETLRSQSNNHPIFNGLTGDFLAGYSEGIINVSESEFDYFKTQGTATIPAGQSSVEVCVPLNPDSLTESSETFKLVISNAVNGVIETGEAIATIADDDGVIECGQEVISEVAGNGVVVFNEPPANAFVLLEYATSALNAVPPNGLENRPYVVIDGITVADTGANVIRYRNYGGGGFAISYQGGEFRVYNSTGNYLNYTAHCPVTFPGNVVGYTGFNTGFSRVVSEIEVPSVGIQAYRISPAESAGDREAFVVCTMFYAPSGNLSVRCLVDDLATVYIQDQNGNVNSAEFSLSAGVQTKNVPMPNVPAEGRVFFISVVLENLPAATACYLALQVIDNSISRPVCSSNSDWMYAKYEDSPIGTSQPIFNRNQQALIFETDAEASTYLTQTVAPTQQEIFNTWYRFAGADYYTSLADIPTSSEADDWFFDSGNDQFVMATNTTRHNAIVSPERKSNYVFEATVSSVDLDDDAIGLVAAFSNSYGVNKSLVVVRTRTGAAPVRGFGLLFIDGNSRSTIHDVAVEEITSGGWDGKFSRIRIVRQGSIIKYSATTFGSTTDYSPEYTFDMASDERMASLVSDAHYGFYTYSQAQSTYSDVLMPTSMYESVISTESYAGRLWEVSNGAWVERTLSEANSGTNAILSKFTRPAIVTNPVTSKQFYVNRVIRRKT